ncbi:MAG: fluoride efflux transporter CrcB [Candidatus Omnitrophica bacterium CG11_big_fil_rev_8_21_14_0_20_45_26]|uniref:Fluoride-specific ion channel FluC n=1 Tax=Candidatus Abzuiibacterium crystallinum TaxID=1974748 RepID=A0A2H0LMU0_9BACT|nr:MAG: fluoride efflux transporter CrcB [Candidatus Omnitrophica bacterium CG11_big_fil_rev_8_21_14_0_20_45_26]PIW65197.1 MAG: fluoride efflux transporter CrcB [Candidatus Omnitrophica bacterium CG12_big_fil_rev_8_21_14_0_65_45_16]
MPWVSLMLGGCLGTLCRYLVSGGVHQLLGTQFPYGTLSVNILGCFLVGFLAAIGEERFLLSTEARLFLIIGFCGAFTTFSTFMFETADLIRAGESWRAFFYVISSVSVGFAVFRLGFLAGRTL